MDEASGYPAGYVRRARQSWIRSTKIILVAVVITCFLIYHAIYLNGDMLLAALASAGCLFFLWIEHDTGISRVGITLYFEKTVPGTSPWSKVLARNCTVLDELAVKAGVLPLSAFGFADDFHNEIVTWHEPEQGLRTISYLLQKLRDNSSVIDDAEEAIRDLTQIEARLQEACKTQTRFCFIMHYDAINGMEVEQRKGHF